MLFVFNNSTVKIMASLLFHSLFLVLSVGRTFLWTQNPNLTPYNLQAVGLIILFYFAGKFIGSPKARLAALLDAVIFTILILFLVITTGGVHSPVFFLLYFLLFAVSLLFEPAAAIVISLLLTLFFGFNLRFNFDNLTLINLATLLLITPLANLFGRKFLETQVAAGKIKLLDQIIQSEETQTLIWLSTKAKPTLINLLDTTSLIISSNLLPYALQQKLKSLHQDLVTLHQSASILEKEIDEASEE